jgi:hypothetical protein
MPGRPVDSILLAVFTVSPTTSREISPFVTHSQQIRTKQLEANALASQNTANNLAAMNAYSERQIGSIRPQRHFQCAGKPLKTDRSQRLRVSETASGNKGKPTNPCSRARTGQWPMHDLTAALVNPEEERKNEK